MGNIVTSGVLGYVVGDALGLAYQGMSKEKIEGTNIVMDGFEDIPKGYWSDDTSTMLCTMESLSNGLDYRDIGDKLNRWITEGYMTPQGKAFGAGKTTIEALGRYESDSNVLELGSADERSNGNGSLMRMLPLAYYLYAKDIGLEESIKIINNVSSITHRHVTAKTSCVIYTLFAMSLIEGNTMWNAYIDLKDKIEILSSNKDIELNGEAFSRILDNNIIMYDEKELWATGYCVDTLEAVFWSFLNGDGYADCVLKAIKLGGDTDTIAALTGALAGIYYEEEDISPEWINQIVKKEEIINLGNKFYNYLIESTN
ncbi:ADP-ribosylglycohydrolase family protein [Clostridium sp.]|uniref:ADP-ribosylglycohydrolase family protein n=1 Tax=Clostridium sp. TaxID=1506 RepID=UPI002FC5B21D